MKASKHLIELMQFLNPQFTSEIFRDASYDATVTAAVCVICISCNHCIRTLYSIGCHCIL